jgi:hypothetical protein
MKKNKTYSLFNIFHTGNRICGFVIILFLSFAGSLSAQNQSPEILRQKMAKIRQSTDWNDPVAAKKANDEIKILSKELMMSGKNQNPVNHKDSVQLKQEKEGVEYKMKLWDQMQESAKQGEGADILLAKPIREIIKEEYRNDEAEGLNPAMLSECTTLILDFSVPITQTLVSQMELFQSIKTLIIIGVESLVPVDLNYILNKAKNYPLYELYIVGFDAGMKKIPENIMLFRELNTLVLYGNQLSALPSGLIQLKNLKILNINFNPVQTIEPLSSLVKNLEELSIRETEIPQTEVAVLKQKFPNCKIQSE